MENENLLERSLEIASIRRYRVRIYENEILYQELQLSLMEITAKLLTNTPILKRIDIRLKSD